MNIAVIITPDIWAAEDAVDYVFLRECTPDPPKCVDVIIWIIYIRLFILLMLYIIITCTSGHL